jgi:hypothetical protein
MAGVLLEPAAPPKLKAREIVVAPRLPELRTAGYKSPFDAEGDVVADCDLCGYHVIGSRRDVGAAMREHHRLYHHHQTGVVLLNAPRQ